jgi:hypothetical protein
VYLTHRKGTPLVCSRVPLASSRVPLMRSRAPLRSSRAQFRPCLGAGRSEDHYSPGRSYPAPLRRTTEAQSSGGGLRGKCPYFPLCVLPHLCGSTLRRRSDYVDRAP